MYSRTIARSCARDGTNGEPRRSSTGRLKFSRTPIPRINACSLRSSGTSAMPRSTASPGCRIATGVPSSRISPRSILSAPNRQRTNSVRPAPTSPAKPTISPARTAKSIVVQHPAPRQPAHLQPHRRVGRTRLGEQARQVTPDHHPHQQVLRRLRHRHASPPPFRRAAPSPAARCGTPPPAGGRCRRSRPLAPSAPR